MSWPKSVFSNPLASEPLTGRSGAGYGTRTLASVTAERNLNAQEENVWHSDCLPGKEHSRDLGLGNLAGKNQVEKERGSRQTTGRSGAHREGLILSRRGFRVLKVNGLSFPWEENQNPCLEQQKLCFPDPPLLCGSGLSCTARSWGWWESSYYSQEVVVVVPGNEQTHNCCCNWTGQQLPACIPSTTSSSSQLLTSTQALRQLHGGQQLNQFSGSPEMADPRYLSSAPPLEFHIRGLVCLWLRFPHELWRVHLACSFSDCFLGPSVPSFKAATSQCLPHVFNAWILQPMLLSVTLAGAPLP